jgi:hypothetical protein
MALHMSIQEGSVKLRQAMQAVDANGAFDDLFVRGRREDKL